MFPLFITAVYMNSKWNHRTLTFAIFFCFAFQRPYRSKVSNHFSITGNKQINWIKAHWVGGRDEKERDGYEERERERYRRVTSEVCAAGDTIEVATGD